LPIGDSRAHITHLALALYLYNEQDYDGALGELKSALQLDPSFWEARKFMGEILLTQERKEEALEAYGDLVPQLNVPYLKFQCANCGFRPSDLQWQCPQCKKWDTITLMDSRMDESQSSQQLSRSPSELPQKNTETQ
jgi:lipopolysaccharide biosynthesis regulator YciM